MIGAFPVSLYLLEPELQKIKKRFPWTTVKICNFLATCSCFLTAILVPIMAIFVFSENFDIIFGVYITFIYILFSFHLICTLERFKIIYNLTSPLQNLLIRIFKILLLILMSGGIISTLMYTYIYKWTDFSWQSYCVMMNIVTVFALLAAFVEPLLIAFMIRRVIKDVIVNVPSSFNSNFSNPGTKNIDNSITASSNTTSKTHTSENYSVYTEYSLLPHPTKFSCTKSELTKKIMTSYALTLLLDAFVVFLLVLDTYFFTGVFLVSIKPFLRIYPVYHTLFVFKVLDSMLEGLGLKKASDAVSNQVTSHS
ncbi:hypothetical protein HDU92_004172 [Lobulomyces angularis]|nr:hypothetical protein HDU92_004172 [Lobulomyces angularis]